MDGGIDSEIGLQPNSLAWTRAQPTPSAVHTPASPWDLTHAGEGEPFSSPSWANTPSHRGSTTQDTLGYPMHPSPLLGGLFLRVHSGDIVHGGQPREPRTACPAANMTKHQTQENTLNPEMNHK